MTFVSDSRISPWPTSCLLSFLVRKSVWCRWLAWYCGGPDSARLAFHRNCLSCLARTCQAAQAKRDIFVDQAAHPTFCQYVFWRASKEVASSACSWSCQSLLWRNRFWGGPKFSLLRWVMWLLSQTTWLKKCADVCVISNQSHLAHQDDVRY